MQSFQLILITVVGLFAELITLETSVAYVALGENFTLTCTTGTDRPVTLHRPGENGRSCGLCDPNVFPEGGFSTNCRALDGIRYNIQCEWDAGSSAIFHINGAASEELGMWECDSFTVETQYGTNLSIIQFSTNSDVLKCLNMYFTDIIQ